MYLDGNELKFEGELSHCGFVQTIKLHYIAMKWVNSLHFQILHHLRLNVSADRLPIS